MHPFPPTSLLSFAGRRQHPVPTFAPSNPSPLPLAPIALSRRAPQAWLLPLKPLATLPLLSLFLSTLPPPYVPIKHHAHLLSLLLYSLHTARSHPQHIGTQVTHPLTKLPVPHTDNRSSPPHTPHTLTTTRYLPCSGRSTHCSAVSAHRPRRRNARPPTHLLPKTHLRHSSKRDSGSNSHLSFSGHWDPRPDRRDIHRVK